MTNDKDEAEGFVFVQEPDGRGTREARYAAAMTAAAVANQRIQALEGMLAVSEYHRDQAETELSGMRWDKRLGRVYTHADEEPDAQVVMDIRNGTFWQVDDNAEEWTERWFRRDGDGEAYYRSGWPIEDHGPFIAITEEYGALANIERAERRRATEERIHRRLSQLPGYRADEDGRWSRPETEGAVSRVIEAKDKKMAEMAVEKSNAEEALKRGREEWLRLKKERDNGYGDIIDGVVKALPKPGAWSERTIHQIVKDAENAILQDCEVPVEGDPEYAGASLMSAAALLIAAVDEMVRRKYGGGAPAEVPF